MREEKRWLRHGNGLSHFSLLAAKFICAPGVIKAEQNDTLTKDKTPRLEPENIRESILDFTDHFGEINPDILYLCRRGLSELKKAVFAFFPSVRRESMKKNVKSSIFRKKTSKFLSSLPFKTQTIDNQREYDDASASKANHIYPVIPKTKR